VGVMGAEVPGEPAVRLRPGVFSPEHESPQEFQQRLVTERAMLMRKLELDAELGVATWAAARQIKQEALGARCEAEAMRIQLEEVRREIEEMRMGEVEGEQSGDAEREHSSGAEVSMVDEAGDDIDWERLEGRLGHFVNATQALGTDAGVDAFRDGLQAALEADARDGGDGGAVGCWDPWRLRHDRAFRRTAHGRITQWFNDMLDRTKRRANASRGEGDAAGEMAPEWDPRALGGGVAAQRAQCAVFARWMLQNLDSLRTCNVSGLLMVKHQIACHHTTAQSTRVAATATGLLTGKPDWALILS
jgi:hypothetical protein